MKTIFLFLITGFEEIEAIATIDILRRAALDVKTVSLTGKLTVSGGHGVPVTADMLFENMKFEMGELLIIPGGTVAFNNHEGLRKAVKSFYDKGKKVAAICASPIIFGTLGLLKGRRATCYPGFEQYLEGAILETDKSVIVDGNVITGRGPGWTIDFALKLVEIIAGKNKRDEIAAQLLVK